MSTENNKITHWDKTKVYGYIDDELVDYKFPDDNFICIQGCDEILTREEIFRMFPNQILLLELQDASNQEYNVFEKWTRAKVLWYHESVDTCADHTEQAGWPLNYLKETTYTEKGVLVALADIDSIY